MKYWYGGSKPSPSASLISKAHTANLCNELLIRKRKRALLFWKDEQNLVLPRLAKASHPKGCARSNRAPSARIHDKAGLRRAGRFHLICNQAPARAAPVRIGQPAPYGRVTLKARGGPRKSVVRGTSSSCVVSRSTSSARYSKER